MIKELKMSRYWKLHPLKINVSPYQKEAISKIISGNQQRPYSTALLSRKQSREGLEGKPLCYVVWKLRLQFFYKMEGGEWEERGGDRREEEGRGKRKGRICPCRNPQAWWHKAQCASGTKWWPACEPGKAELMRTRPLTGTETAAEWPCSCQWL